MKQNYKCHRIECKVTEEVFPYFKKCCVKSTGMSGPAYEKSCTYCNIWTSMPDSTSLEMAHIVECVRYGYGKRIKG